MAKKEEKEVKSEPKKETIIEYATTGLDVQINHKPDVTVK